MRGRTLPLLLGLLLALVLFAISTLSTTSKHALHTQGRLHPWLHLLGFASIAFFLLRATGSTALRLVLVAAVLLFGYATEARESRKDGWPIEQQDVRTDTVGALAGSLFSLLVSRPRHPKAAQEEL